MKKMILLFAAFLLATALAANVADGEINSNLNEISNLKSQIVSLESKIKTNSWNVRYANYGVFQNLRAQLASAKKELASTPKSDAKNLARLNGKIASLTDQLEILREYDKSPFQGIFVAPEIEAPEKITNPIAMISGYSQIKHLKSLKNEYNQKLADLGIAIETLEKEGELLAQIVSLDDNDSNLNSLAANKQKLDEFTLASEVATTTFGVYQKKLDEAIIGVENEIKAQVKQTLSILITIIAISLIGFLCKFLAKRYITDNQKSYTVNKFINIINFTVIIFILLFAYIENVSYVVTILGFASAGLAIAMKDMFMSLLGWSVIVAGGSVHVGDRIRVRYEGSEFVGDIIDISLLRITIYEDVTLTTYMTNRRSGRIIFIPNNYIFTDLIANYSHGGMKTVWDGIDICISFDSNHKKAVYIIKNIARKYSKGYTDIAKSQMNKLRDQYSIKNSNVEPRIFTFLESYGIVVSVWYETNSFATLGLRSTICAEIIDAIKKEPDVKIAFPKQTLYLNHTDREEIRLPDIPDVSKDILY